jgi:hypothetical protein
VLAGLGAETAVIAAAVKARRNVSGNSRPLFAARLSIPRHAFGLKKNFGGTLGSKMPDNEHAPAALGDSEELCIQHAPRHTVPEFIQRGEDRFEVSALVRTEQSGNILQEKPARS